ncbi:YciE/YciF family protein [Pantoea rodasii]|uniref:YciE/YciF family protein n=1 Tax=Pantoea rodasii TaxID=1076549 RepID=A0A2M9W6P2_9GAMM|nr:DUF892 family protein [Pantoea rodasii]ORM62766.1 YciE/YciF family protein [Pantoea rodasii]PJZ03197.1 YciE/YciF family protein [Pantoea rodasii]
MMRESVYLDWLRDAHAMELHSETLLKAAVQRLNDHPSMKMRITQYLEQIREQQQLVKDVLKSYDGSWSILKDTLGRMSAVGQAASDMLRDEMGVRIAVSGYVFCSYKVATYTTLVAAAEQADDSAGKNAFQRILQQEVQMADWLLLHLPEAANESIDKLTEAEASDAI